MIILVLVLTVATSIVPTTQSDGLDDLTDTGYITVNIIETGEEQGLVVFDRRPIEWWAIDINAHDSLNPIPGGTTTDIHINIPDDSSDGVFDYGEYRVPGTYDIYPRVAIFKDALEARQFKAYVPIDVIVRDSQGAIQRLHDTVVLESQLGRYWLNPEEFGFYNGFDALMNPVNMFSFDPRFDVDIYFSKDGSSYSEYLPDVKHGEPIYLNIAIENRGLEDPTPWDNKNEAEPVPHVNIFTTDNLRQIIPGSVKILNENGATINEWNGQNAQQHFFQYAKRARERYTEYEYWVHSDSNQSPNGTGYWVTYRDVEPNFWLSKGSPYTGGYGQHLSPTGMGEMDSVLRGGFSKRGYSLHDTMMLDPDEFDPELYNKNNDWVVIDTIDSTFPAKYDAYFVNGYGTSEWVKVYKYEEAYPDTVLHYPSFAKDGVGNDYEEYKLKAGEKLLIECQLTSDSIEYGSLIEDMQMYGEDIDLNDIPNWVPNEIIPDIPDDANGGVIVNVVGYPYWPHDAPPPFPGGDPVDPLPPIPTEPILTSAPEMDMEGGSQINGIYDPNDQSFYTAENSTVRFLSVQTLPPVEIDTKIWDPSLELWVDKPINPFHVGDTVSFLCTITSRGSNIMSCFEPGLEIVNQLPSDLQFLETKKVMISDIEIQGQTQSFMLSSKDNDYEENINGDEITWNIDKGFSTQSDDGSPDQDSAAMTYPGVGIADSRFKTVMIGFEAKIIDCKGTPSSWGTSTYAVEENNFGLDGFSHHYGSGDEYLFYNTNIPVFDTSRFLVITGEDPKPGDNLPPVANDDEVETTVNTSVIIDFLENDGDPDGELNPLEVKILEEPSHGTLNIIDNEIEDKVVAEYTPLDGYVGEDSFVYLVCDDDGAPSNEALVIIIITDEEDDGDDDDDDDPVDPVEEVDIEILKPVEGGFYLRDQMKFTTPFVTFILGKFTINASVTINDPALNVTDIKFFLDDIELGSLEFNPAIKFYECAIDQKLVNIGSLRVVPYSDDEPTSYEAQVDVFAIILSV